MIPLVRPYFGKKGLSYVKECYDTGWISSQGKFIPMFEEAFADYIGTRYALATSSGTTALHLALLGLNIGDGVDVAVPDITFPATINAVLHSQATPAIIGVNEDWNLNWDDVRQFAAIPVHLYGVPCRIQKKTVVVEDCAEALGATIDGKKVGSIGDCGAFSFFANKIITTGEGGMVTTNSEEVYDKMKLLRDHGIRERYCAEVVGYNYRMTNPQAALGLAQLEEMGEILAYRDLLADWYCEYLGEKRKPGITWLYTTLVDNRDAIMKRLVERNIDSRPVFKPLSSMKVYEKYAHAKFPDSHAISERGISLPTFYGMTKAQVKEVCEVLRG